MFLDHERGIIHIAVWNIGTKKQEQDNTLEYAYRAIGIEINVYEESK